MCVIWGAASLLGYEWAGSSRPFLGTPAHGPSVCPHSPVRDCPRPPVPFPSWKKVKYASWGLSSPRLSFRQAAQVGGGRATSRKATRPRADGFLQGQTVQRPLPHGCNGNFSAGPGATTAPVPTLLKDAIASGLGAGQVGEVTPGVGPAGARVGQDGAHACVGVCERMGGQPCESVCVRVELGGGCACMWGSQLRPLRDEVPAWFSCLHPPCGPWSLRTVRGAGTGCGSPRSSSRPAGSGGDPRSPQGSGTSGKLFQPPSQAPAGKQAPCRGNRSRCGLRTGCPPRGHSGGCPSPHRPALRGVSEGPLESTETDQQAVGGRRHGVSRAQRRSQPGPGASEKPPRQQHRAMAGQVAQPWGLVQLDTVSRVGAGGSRVQSWGSGNSGPQLPS